MARSGRHLGSEMSSITQRQAHAAWIRAEKIKRITDRLVGVGFFSVGLDGLLAFVPVAGTLFSLGAGAVLIREAARARVSRFTLARMTLYVGARTLVSVIPVEGWVADFFFRGHLFAANALQKDIAARFGAPPRAAIAEARRRPFATRSPLADPIAAS